ncbi:MAG TPA: threonine synthase [Steroidobacteraceae bacterium]|nr:threonine synthase [Steroidobacteraceae bacterium]
MNFISTRNPATRVTLSDAIARGIAPDGGLYIPESFPQIAPEAFAGKESIGSVAEELLKPFFAGDAMAAELPAICLETFNFPAPLVKLSTSGPAHVLELFHGPTAAFKDFGARFLAATMERIRSREAGKLTILVATSGDTGGAVAAAFHRRPKVEVAVLYPKGLVSPRQAQQLACWGDNIQTFTVRGSFDECQRVVKEAFLDAAFLKTHQLSSANSINVGRLLPQMVYYATSSLEIWRKTGGKANFIIPSGNVGNAAACIFAKQSGLPIGDIVLATNANKSINEYLATGDWQPRASVATLANAMDVGNPSNMERLRTLFPNVDAMRSQVCSDSVTDAQIRTRIATDLKELGQVWCPHTAVAAEVYSRLAATRGAEQWVIVSTAHPAKFNDIVEPLIGRSILVPEALAKLLLLPKQETEIAPTLDALRKELQA